MNAARSVDEAVRAALGTPPARGSGRVAVGYSGGLDSTVLLHAAAEMIDDRRRILALHVNHGLSPNADAWQRHCESVSAALGVCFSSRRVHVVPGGSPEAAARRARYEAFRATLDGDDVLWLGHHLDDQAETVLWRLMRGGGAAALSGMPASRRLGRGWLQRPLLDVPRADIAAWAHARGIDWIDDESNSDRRYERNFIRHEVLPVLQRLWPDAPERLRRAARRFDDEAVLLRRVLDAQLDEAGAASGTLAVSLLAEPHARLLLRRWLEREGVGGVRERVLEEVVRQAHGAADRVPEIVVADGFSVRRYAQRLYVVDDVPTALASTPWRLGVALDTPAGVLDSRKATGVGLRASVSVVEVRARRGGERMRPAGRHGSRSVKRLLQEAHVPPWLRFAYPLIYVDGRLAAVPGIAVDAAFAETSQDAWLLTLRVRDHRVGD